MKNIFNLKSVFVSLLTLFLFAYSFNSKGQNCSVNANVDLSLCANETMLLIGQKAGLFEGSGTTTWSQVEGPSVIITNPNSLTTTVTGFTGGNSYKFRLSTVCKDGTLTYDDVVYTVKPITQSNAGADMTFCPGTPAGNMAANPVGLNETGSWSIIGTNNGVTLTNNNSPTSPISIANNKSGNTSLVWTINNTNGCLSKDTVIIKNRGGVSPVDAGTDKILTNCYSTTQSVAMTASFGGSGIDGQIGTWTVISGPNIPTISNVNSNTATVSNLIQGTYTLRWTVSGPCVNGFDDVQIVVPAPTSSVTTASIVGGNQTFCDGRTSTVLMGKIPTYINEVVSWTKTAGPAVNIESPNNPVTNITGLNGSSSYTFKYTITNTVTGCTSSANVTVGYSTPATLTISTPQVILPCAQTYVSIPYTTSGSGTVQWSIISGPKTPTYPTIPTNWANASGSPLTINGLTVSGTYVIRLRKSSGTGNECNTVTADVTVVVSQNPTASNSGTKQVLACNVTQTALAGNDPYVGVGTWSQVSGPNTAIIDSVNKFNSGISGLTNGMYVFRWLIAGGPYCATKQTDVSVIVVSTNPSQANAGPDQDVCVNTPVYLNANTPLLNETGTWSVIPSSGVTFSNINSPNAIVNGLSANTTYKFVWKMENACNFNTDTVLVTTNSTIGPIASNAGQDQCLPSGTTSITLAGNNPNGGTGTWTKISGNSANITNPNQYNTTVTGLTDGTYTFEWAILSNGACLPTRDTVMITISSPTSNSLAGADQQICGNSVNLTANNPTVGTGQWSQITGHGGATIVNANSNTTIVNGLQNGVYQFAWTISNGACPTKADTVDVYVTNPPTVPNAGADFTVCGYDTTSLNANTITVGTGSWSLVSGPNTPTFANVYNPNTKVTGLITGTYIFRWTSYNGPFCSPSFDDVEVKVVLPANAGANQSYCESTTTVNLTGNTPSVGTWSQVSGPNTSTITKTSDNTATASGLIPGIYTFRYTISANGCNSTSDMTVTLYTPPTVADAGADQSLCAKDTIFLNGNTPISGTGVWTKLSGPTGGTFKPNANTPNAIFTGAVTGTYVFVWTISNQTCSNADQVIVKNFAMPSNANAGNDQNIICANSTVMSANLPSVGLGNWSLISGPNTPNIVSPILPNSSITNLIPGTYNLEWSISNGTCPVKRDTVALIVYEQPSVADAGPDQNLCEQTSTVMNATAPTIGTGTWTQVSGPNTAVIDNTTSHNTQISGLTYGTYVFNWTTSLPPCSNTDQVIINVSQSPTIANAGADINNCLFSPLTLNGNNPTVGTGKWTQISGPNTANIISPNNYTTNVIGVIPGNYSFVWTISNGFCNSSSDTVNVVVSDIPTMAVAGIDQEHCNATTLNLSGNTPTVGSGLWSQTSGPAVNIVNANLPNTTVNNVVPGNYSFKWQISNNFCISTDEVFVTVHALPSTSNAGSNQEYCNANTFTLNATPPASGTGTWSKVSGPAAIITNTGSPNTTVTGVTTGTYVFRWTVSNGTCTPSISDVTITNYSLPTVANAGSNQSICSSSVTMNANTPATGNIGTWSQISGPNTANIVNINQKNTIINNLVQGTYVFRWTITNGTCTPSTSDVTINVFENPTVSNAGTNQTLCSASSVTLNGNQPTIGTGTWSLVSGPNTPSFDNVSLYNTTVNNLTVGTYVFKWTISNGVCTPSSSQVTIINNPSPTTANAGISQNLCNANQVTLNGNIPTVGTGKWTLISGPNTPNIVDTLLNNTNVTGLIPGTYIFRWSISNANCTPSTSEVTINNYNLPDISNAGSDQSFCKSLTSTTLNGNNPTSGTGQWTQITGPNTAIIANPNNFTTSISGLVMGLYTFKWTISNGVCTPSTSQVNVELVNCIPVAVNDTNSTLENTPVWGNLLPNDSDPDGDTLEVTSFIINGVSYPVGSSQIIPNIGTIIIYGDGSYLFAPKNNWSGTVPNIPYTIIDGYGGTATAELILTVIPVPHYIDLSVTKLLTYPDPMITDSIFKNDTVTFTITLKNNSSIYNATNIVVLDTLPSSFTYISSTTSSGTYDALTGLWTIAQLNKEDIATLTITAIVDTSGQNDVYILSQDDIDTVLYNNKSFASVTITNTSSGNDGGVESNGNMASKLALRKFLRHKERDNRYENALNLEVFTGDKNKTSRLKSVQSTDLPDFIPLTGPVNSTAYISTPNDLIGSTNAIEVISVDYFKNNTSRNAAILGLATPAGTVYEHTKLVCDRLDGATLTSANYVTINGKQFIITRLVQDNGDVDYAISFIAYKNGNTYTIDNKWDIDSYLPTTNQPVLNYQVWSKSERYTVELMENLISNMVNKGFNVQYANTTAPVIPGVYVQNGYYKDGNLYMNLINKNGANSISFNGTKALIENGTRIPYTNSASISTSLQSQTSIYTGYVFDIGFTMSNNVSSGKDAIYFADGPWGYEYDETGASISDFSISPQFAQLNPNYYNLPRSSYLEGTVKTYASLYRILRVGNKPVNVTNYNAIEFTASGIGTFELVVSKNSITSWNNQYKTNITLSNNPTTFTIPFSQLKNSMGQNNFTANDVVAVVLVKKGNGSTYQNFSINIANLRFVNNVGINESENNKISNIEVYPNPFNTYTTVTFNIPKSGKVKISLLDINGKLIREIKENYYQSGINQENINADGLKQGVYIIKLEADNNTYYNKVILMK